ncbi:MAG: SAM-dependent methyltransferase [Gaiellaceae bacterium]
MVSQVVDRVIASGAVPEPLLRAGIRASCATRLRRERRLDRKEAFIASLGAAPIALQVAKPNEQHYEVPPAFFRLVLGPRLKYSSCYWPAGVETLAAAEEAMLALTCERAGVEDGMAILDLGCGWGSLTGWLAERYPRARIVAVSNSRTQRQTIEALRQPNVTVLTADANTLDLSPRRFDRILSVEMLEHMRNYGALLARIASWLDADGSFFCHVFSHAELAYPYDAGWMTRRFFTAGTMLSDDLLPRFDRHLSLEEHWRVGGEHYARTSEAWLDRMAENRDEIVPLLGGRAAYNEWRVFFLACAELWGYRGGREWIVSHYRFSRADSRAR